LRFTSRKLLKYQGKNELLKHMESSWISILINLVRIKLRKTDGIRNTNTIAIIRQIKHQAAYLR